MGVFKKGKYWYIDYYHKGKRKRKKIGPNKKLAEQALKDVQAKIAKGEFLGVYEQKKVLFEAYTEEYLEYCKENKAQSTYERRDIISIKHLIKFFSGKYLTEVTAHDIEKYKAERLQDVSPSTVNREITCLKAMYNRAIEWGYVKTNPTKNVKRLKEPPGRLRYLMPDEMEQLIENCANHLKPIVITALNTGMRKSEILNLQWKEVDLDNSKIKVKNSKSNKSRIIPINYTLQKVFLSLDLCLNSDYVFYNKNGEPFGSVKKAFATALKKAEIEDFVFHDLRPLSHLIWL